MRLARWLLASTFLLACSNAHDPDDADSAVAPADGGRGDASRLDASAPSIDAALLDARTPSFDAAWDAALGSPYARCDGRALPSEWGLMEVARADQFGPGGRFVALDGLFALVSSDTAPDVLIAVLPNAGSPAQPRISQLALAAGRRAVAVADTRSDTFAAWVLTCADTGGNCELTTVVGGAQNDLSDVTVASAAGSNLGPSYEPSGLTWALNRPCIFGSHGISCLEDGHWAGGFLPTDDGDSIVGFQPGPLSLAVSRQGHVWVGTNTPNTLSLTQQAMLEPPLSGAISDAAKAFVYGHGSVWARQADSTFTRLLVQGSVQGVWLTHPSQDPAFLLSSGLIVVPAAGSFCWNLQLHANEPVLATSDAPCGLASNLRAITEHRLISQNICPID